MIRGWPGKNKFELQIFQNFEFDKPILGICGGEQHKCGHEVIYFKI